MRLPSPTGRPREHAKVYLRNLVSCVSEVSFVARRDSLESVPGSAPATLSEVTRESRSLEDLKGALEDVVRIGTIILTVVGIAGLVWWLASFPGITIDALKSFAASITIVILILAFLLLRIRRRLLSARAESQSLKTDNDMLQSSLQREQTRVSTLEAGVREADAKTARAEEHSKQLAAQLQEVENDLHASAMRERDLGAQVERMKADLSHREESLGKLEQERSGLRSELVAAQGEIQRSTRSQEDAKRRATELEGQVRSLQAIPQTAERPILATSYSVNRPLLFGRPSHNLAITNRGKGAALNVQLLIQFSAATVKYSTASASWQTEALGPTEATTINLGSDEELQGARTFTVRLRYQDKAGRSFDSLEKTISLG